MIELYAPPNRPTLKLVKGQQACSHFIPHAYTCQPLLDANRFGWDRVCDQDMLIRDHVPIAGPGLPSVRDRCQQRGQFQRLGSRLVSV